MDLLTSPTSGRATCASCRTCIQRAVILCEGTLEVDETWFAETIAGRRAGAQFPGPA